MFRRRRQRSNPVPPMLTHKKNPQIHIIGEHHYRPANVLFRNNATEYSKLAESGYYLGLEGLPYEKKSLKNKIIGIEDELVHAYARLVCTYIWFNREGNLSKHLNNAMDERVIKGILSFCFQSGFVDNKWVKPIKEIDDIRMNLQNSAKSLELSEARPNVDRLNEGVIYLYLSSNKRLNYITKQQNGEIKEGLIEEGKGKNQIKKKYYSVLIELLSTKECLNKKITHEELELDVYDFEMIDDDATDALGEIFNLADSLRLFHDISSVFTNIPDSSLLERQGGDSDKMQTIWMEDNKDYILERREEFSEALKAFIYAMRDMLLMKLPKKFYSHPAFHNKTLEKVFLQKHFFNVDQKLTKLMEVFLVDLRNHIWVNNMIEINNKVLPQGLSIVYIVGDAHLDGLKELIKERYHEYPVIYYSDHDPKKSPLHFLDDTRISMRSKSNINEDNIPMDTKRKRSGSI